MQMTDGAEDLFAQALSVFEAAIVQLCDGTIHFGTLDILLTHHQQVLDLFQLVNAVGGGVRQVPLPTGPDRTKVDCIQKLLMWRETEKKRFEQLHQQFLHFLDLCGEVKNSKHCVAFSNCIFRQLNKICCQFYPKDASLSRTASYEPLSMKIGPVHLTCE